MNEFMVPRYGENTLADLVGSISHRITAGRLGEPALALPEARRYVLVMVDGLGLELLEQYQSRAPFLASLLPDALQLTCGVPSTTATSLTSLGTGLCPGAHGTVGYTFRYQGQLLNPLLWDLDVDPCCCQPNPTWFEKLLAAGYQATTVSLERFADSGLTNSGLRGAKFIGLSDEEDNDAKVAQLAAAANATERGIVYGYERRLDFTGHTRGCHSGYWRTMLDEIDGWLEQLFDALPNDCAMVVTGDHGMLDVPKKHQIVIEDDPQLVAGLDLIGGEGRMRQLFTSQADQVIERWRTVLADRAVVYSRDEAIAAGWFGPVANAEIAQRIGDVVVAMRGDWAVMTNQKPKELRLVGQHGSLTSAEMRVPGLIVSK